MTDPSLSDVFIAGCVAGSFLSYAIDTLFHSIFRDWEDSGAYPVRNVAETTKQLDDMPRA